MSVGTHSMVPRPEHCTAITRKLQYNEKEEKVKKKTKIPTISIVAKWLLKY